MPVRTPKQRRILARVAPEQFVGRGEQLRELTALGSARAEQRGLLLFAAPQSGVSELLRQSFDEMFRQRGGPAPVYFAFTRADAATTAAARRFLQTFLTQVVAHRRDDPAFAAPSATSARRCSPRPTNASAAVRASIRLCFVGVFAGM